MAALRLLLALAAFSFAHSFRGTQIVFQRPPSRTHKVSLQFGGLNPFKKKEYSEEDRKRAKSFLYGDDVPPSASPNWGSAFEEAEYQDEGVESAPTFSNPFESFKNPFETMFAPGDDLQEETTTFKTTSVKPSAPPQPDPKPSNPFGGFSFPKSPFDNRAMEVKVDEDKLPSPTPPPPNPFGGFSFPKSPFDNRQ